MPCKPISKFQRPTWAGTLVNLWYLLCLPVIAKSINSVGAYCLFGRSGTSACSLAFTGSAFMAANESYYNSFCLKSVSHGALECDSPRRWNIIRGSKKKEVDPPFSLCVGRFALLQLRNSLCAQIEKNPYLNPTICNGPKPYMKSKLQGIILGFQKVFSSLKLLNAESFWKFHWHQNWNATP